MPRTPEEEARYQELSKKYGSQNTNQKKSGFDINNFMPRVNPRPESFGQAFMQHPAIAIPAGAIDESLRMLNTAEQTLSGARPFPETNLGQGGYAKVGKGLANIAPQMIAKTAPGRAFAAGAQSYLMNPEDPIQGVIDELPYYLGGELGGPVLGKTAEYVGDKFTRNKYTKDLLNAITEQFKGAKEQALNYLNPLMEKVGHYKMDPRQIETIKSTYEMNKEYMGPEAKRFYTDFIKNPTPQTAQHLQSHMGKEMGRLAKSAVPNLHAEQGIKEFRDTILDGIGNTLENISPYAKKEYDSFRGIWRDKVVPFESTPQLADISHGARKGYTPQKVDNALVKAIESDLSNVPQGHSLRKSAADMESKLARTKNYNKAGQLAAYPITAALGAGAFGTPGILAAGFAPQASKIMGGLSELLLDDSVIKAIEKIYPTARQAGIGYRNAPESKKE